MNNYIIKLVQASCLSGILYWGTDYKLNYVFWLGSLIFFITSLIIAYLQELNNKNKSIIKLSREVKNGSKNRKN